MDHKNLEANIAPYVTEKTPYGERVYDIYTRLLKNRIIFIGGPINDMVANAVVGQLLFLNSEDETKDIMLYINSPGGMVNSALAIYDTMQFVKPAIITVGFGIVASAAAVLLSAGSKGKRKCLPNTELLLHQIQLSGGLEGAAADIEIEARQIMKMKNRLNEILARHTGQPLPVIEKDTDRNFWLSAEEAKAYGVIDEVVAPNEEKFRKAPPPQKGGK